MKIGIYTLLIISLTLKLYAEAVNSGSTVSVNSDSSFNALRNPALMSHQQTENISFMYMYSYLMHSKADADLTFGAVSVELDPEISEDYNGAFYISDVEHSGQNSYGIGISRAGDGQVIFSSTQLDSTGFSSTEDKVYIGSTLMLSYAYKMNNTESIGLQIETAAFIESKESDEIDGTDKKNLQIDKTRVTSGCTLGYSLRENDFEFGVMLKSGRYGFENQKYKLDINGIGSEKKISNYFMNDEGPGVLFGFGIKPRGGYLVCFETGYLIPYTHEEKSCDEDTLAEITGDINLKYAYTLKCGINYNYSSFINFGFGGSYTKSKADSSDEDGIKYGDTDYSIYQLASGIDIKPSKNYTLLFGLIYQRIILDMRTENSTSSVHLGITNDYLNFMAGVACNY